VLALWPVVAGAQEARCLLLDPASPWLQTRAEERSLRSMTVTLMPFGAEMATMNVTAIFAGPSAEAPDAVPDGVYGASYACVPGPAEIWAGDWPVWVQDGGWLCADEGGTIEMQVVEVDGRTALWTTGTTLATPYGNPPVTWTTRGNVSVGYHLVVADDPGICGL
jgi:hypothetical protein